MTIQDRLGDDISIGAKLTSKFRGNSAWIREIGQIEAEIEAEIGKISIEPDLLVLVLLFEIHFLFSVIRAQDFEWKW